jgi:hypothetical protein
MSEDYSLSSDFTGELDSSQLEAEINASAISVDLVGISTYADLVQIVFTTPLGSEDKALLTALVAAHLADPLHIHDYYKLSINALCNTNEYNLVYAFAINDIIKIKPVKFAITSKLTGLITSYSVRVYDVTHNNIIATANFNNSYFSLLDMGVLTSVSTDLAMLELHVKKNGGSDGDFVCISELTIYAD